MVVLVIGFADSFNLPHMAPDNKYYVRLGAHSVPANHYIVEAMRAKRGINIPILRGMLRKHPQKDDVVELAIVSASNAIALDVSIDFSPVPNILSESEYPLPLRTPMIRSDHPLIFEIGAFHSLMDNIGSSQFNLILDYIDIFGTNHTYTQTIEIKSHMSPILFVDKRQQVLDNIQLELREIRVILSKMLKSDST